MPKIPRGIWNGAENNAFLVSGALPTDLYRVFLTPRVPLHSRLPEGSGTEVPLLGTGETMADGGNELLALLANRSIRGSDNEDGMIGLVRWSPEGTNLLRDTHRA